MAGFPYLLDATKIRTWVNPNRMTELRVTWPSILETKASRCVLVAPPMLKSDRELEKTMLKMLMVHILRRTFMAELGCVFIDAGGGES